MTIWTSDEWIEYLKEKIDTGVTLDPASVTSLLHLIDDMNSKVSSLEFTKSEMLEKLNHMTNLYKAKVVRNDNVVSLLINNHQQAMESNSRLIESLLNIINTQKDKTPDG